MSVKRIFSAGGIVIRKVSKVSSGSKVSDGFEVLVTQHSKHKGWEFPKGHIEIGESSEQAALREVEEESGVVGEIIEKVGDCEYFYFDAGTRVLKTVTYYLMKFKGQGEATTAFEVSAKVWLPVGEVEAKLTYKDTKEIWTKAKEKIRI